MKHLAADPSLGPWGLAPDPWDIHGDHLGQRSNQTAVAVMSEGFVPTIMQCYHRSKLTVALLFRKSGLQPTRQKGQPLARRVG